MTVRSIAHFEIERELGRGGMGVVYLARDQHLRRRVALKVLPAAEGSQDGARERFLREARCASALTHPNIVTIYEVVEARDDLCIAMEYVQGETLRDRLRRGPLPAAEALEIARQLLRGLAAAHKAGLIHRDLKPANVMIAEDGSVKILDFGLAKQQSAVDDESVTQTALTGTGIVMGTLGYLAPEQARGEAVDQRADIFSVGVILYELFTGRKPFPQSNPVTWLHAVCYEPPAEWTIDDGSVPPEIRQTIRKALEKDPRNRHQSAAQLAHDLDGVRTASTAGAAPESRPDEPTASLMAHSGFTLPRLFRRRWLSVAAFAAGAWILYELVPARIVQQPPAFETAHEWTEEGYRRLERYYLKENLALAKEAFEAAIAREAAHAPAYAGLALAADHQAGMVKDPAVTAEAVRLGQKAVELNDHLSLAHLALATAYLRAGRQEQSATHAARAAELDPVDPRPVELTGYWHLARKNEPAAEAEFRRAISMAESRWQPRMALGILCYRTARYEEAAGILSHAGRLAPDHPVIFRNLGAALHQLGRADEAISAFQKSLAIQPNPSTFSNLGTLYFYKGEYDDAASAFERAIESGANNYVNWGNLADAYRALPSKRPRAAEHYRHAIALAEKARTVSPGDAYILMDLASYHAKNGEPAQAASRLTELEAQAGLEADVLFSMAVTSELIGERPRALRHLEAALSKGYTLTEVERNPDLLNLRNTGAFHQILMRHRPTNP